MESPSYVWDHSQVNIQTAVKRPGFKVNVTRLLVEVDQILVDQWEGEK